jgi:hypothetical protein
MTTGRELKQKLNLEDLKFVSFIRLIDAPMKVIIVFYDSKKRNVPLTTQRILRASNFYSGRKPPFEKDMVRTPLVPLEDFNGSIRDLMVFSIDISGLNGDTKFQAHEHKEKNHRDMILFPGNLLTELTLHDLKDTSSSSSFTKRTRKQRDDAMKTENFTSKLIDVFIDTVEDHVTFVFLTEATESIYPADYQFGELDPEDDFRIKKNPSKAYELHIRILDFMKWLKETRPDALNDKKITWEEIKDVLKVADIKVFSTSPSFHWQGVNYFLSQVDASIYPTSIAPTFWNQPQYHGSDPYFLDKHLYGLFRQIDFFGNQMASMLQKRMKDRNLI